ncbi:MAG: hypothetical protein R2867_25005 [Caldilineaceae bacterium]
MPEFVSREQYNRRAIATNTLPVGNATGIDVGQLIDGQPAHGVVGDNDGKAHQSPL